MNMRERMLGQEKGANREESTDYDLNNNFPPRLILPTNEASARGPEPDILCTIQGWLAGGVKVVLFKDLSLNTRPPPAIRRRSRLYEP